MNPQHRDCSSLAQVVADDLERPSLDDRQYRVITLPNKLEALLIHDPECDKASAALDVNVGSFADPKDLPGLAHFCEHLLFMGTEKYPAENAYSQYLTEHSGHSNAYTATDETNYFFEVGQEYLEGALDRFAQFFIAPLFLPECKDREIRAVDSENKKNLQSDTWRLHQLDRSLSNPEHPYNKFSTGNLETLDEQPRKRGEDVREVLLKFHAQHYSANLMKLVVIGRESLDILEKWVSEMFSAIRNIDIPPPIYDAQPYTAKELGKIVFAKPVMDQKHMSVYFPVPDQRPLYRSKPASYYSHLIGHEGKGSILQYLKSKSWINGLSAGTEHVCTGTDSFLVDLELTDEGFEHYEEVIETLFAYFQLLRQTPAQEWIYKELEEQTQMTFKFQQKSGSMSTTSRLAATMQRLEVPRNLLLSHHLFREYNAYQIAEFPQYLTPERVRIFLVGQGQDGLVSREKWYGTEYRLESLDNEFVRRLKAVEVPPQLHLPGKNEFIPTNFDVQKKEVEAKDRLKRPTLIRRTDQLRVWHKKDDTFWIPKAEVHISLKSPVAQSTPANAVRAQILVSLINDELTEFAYDAEIAGLRYDVSVVKGGIGIFVGGFNHKLPILQEKVLSKIKEFKVDRERFRVVKQRILRMMRNFGYHVPYSQIATFAHYLLNENVWELEEKIVEMETVEPEDVELLARDLFRNADIEMMAVGNIRKEDALEISDTTVKMIGAKPLSQGQHICARSFLLAPGTSHYQKIPLGDPENINSAIEYVLQVGKQGDRLLKAQLELFSQISSEPAFNTLRTKEQLGYVVFSGTKTTRTTIAYRVLIQSERATEYLEERIDAFLVSMEKQVDTMSDEEFNKHKQALISKKLEKRKNLREEADRYWARIQTGYYDFLQHEDDAKVVESLNKQHVLELMRSFILPKASERAKLVIHLQSQKTPKPTLATIVQSEVINLAILQDIEMEAAEIEVEKSATIENLNEILTSVKDKLVVEKGVRDADAVVLIDAARNNIKSRFAGLPTGYPDGIEISDVALFKSSLPLTEAPVPRYDFSYYMEHEPKL